MPLIKSSSDAAFKTNVGNLMRDIGKSPHVQSQKQALAIAYATKRRNRANGGAVNLTPSLAQKEAGNYKKHHITFHGLDIAIENPKGSTRTGVSKSGKSWSVRMPDHYGYIKRTQGADGDHVDVYLGPDTRSEKVFVVDQVRDDTKHFDEHKAMLGYDSKDAALNAYRKAFSDGKGDARIGAVTELSLEAFKSWLKGDGGKKPIGNGVKKYASGGAVSEDSVASEFARRAAADRTRNATVRGYATGGMPWFSKAESHSMTHAGPIPSIVGGRTDHHPLNVGAGSYVLPSTHLSALGQGNTANGMAVVSRMFSGGPYGTSAMPIKRGTGAPRPPQAKQDGGAADDEKTGAATPIMAAGGEYVLSPEQVAAVGGGDIAHGHAVLDRWVMDTRKSLIKTLKGLPKPAKD